MMPRLALVPVVLLLAGCVASGPTEPVETDLVVVPGPWVFEPEAIRVAAGTEVTWRNDGGQAHTVTFDDGVDLVVAAGASVQRTFASAGTFAYTCRFHPPDMEGTVHVV